MCRTPFEIVSANPPLVVAAACRDERDHHELEADQRSPDDPTMTLEALPGE